MSRTNHTPYQQPLRLWGLTLGVVSDLLHDLDPAATQSLWLWPTFSHWDIRLVVWLMTWRIRRRQQRIDGMDSTTYTTVASGSTTTITTNPPSSSLASTINDSPSPPPSKKQPTLPPSELLDIYFGRMYEGVVYALAARVTLAAAIATVLVWRRRRRVLV